MQLVCLKRTMPSDIDCILRLMITFFRKRVKILKGIIPVMWGTGSNEIVPPNDNDPVRKLTVQSMKSTSSNLTIFDPNVELPNTYISSVV
jgi:hypothetical protein